MGHGSSVLRQEPPSEPEPNGTDRLQFSVPSASEQSKSGSTIVPAGAAYAAFRTRRGSVVNAGTATGCARWARFACPERRTAQLSALTGHRTSAISPMTRFTQRHDSVALGLIRPSRTGRLVTQRPAGWDAWNTGPSKETTIGVGGFSASRQTASDYGMSRAVWDSCFLLEHSCRHARYLPWQYTGPMVQSGLNYSLPAWRQPIWVVTHVPVPSTLNGVWQRRKAFTAFPTIVPVKDFVRATVRCRQLRHCKPGNPSISTTCGCRSGFFGAQQTQHRSLATITLTNGGAGDNGSWRNHRPPIATIGSTLPAFSIRHRGTHQLGADRQGQHRQLFANVITGNKTIGSW